MSTFTVTLDKWHKTFTGLFAFALFELVLGYGFLSLAIDRGNLWYYVLTLILLVGFVQNIVRLLANLFRGVARGK